MVDRLLARLGVTSSNSSKAPSTDGPGVKRETKVRVGGKSRGAQPRHSDTRRRMVPLGEVDAVLGHEPPSCSGCGTALDSGCVSGPEGAGWQVWELPELRARVTHHVARSRCCAACGVVTRGEIPGSILASQFGPQLGSVVCHLLGRYSLSRRDASQLVDELFGVQMSVGTVCALARESGASLQTASSELLDEVRSSPIVNADETSWRIEKKLGWLWVAAAKRAAVFLAHSSRGRVAAEALLGPAYAGTLGTDRWASYDRLVPTARRQFCLAHLLRDAKGMASRGGKGAGIGRDLVDAFGAAIALFHKPTGDPETLGARGAPVRLTCKELLEKGAALTDARDKKTRALCTKLLKREEALWTFLSTPGLEPTNNIAERTIRPAVIARKTSFGSDSADGAVHFARTMSVLATLRMNGKSALNFFAQTLAAARQGLEPPSVLQYAYG